MFLLLSCSPKSVDVDVIVFVGAVIDEVFVVVEVLDTVFVGGVIVTPGVTVTVLVFCTVVVVVVGKVKTGEVDVEP